MTQFQVLGGDRPLTWGSCFSDWIAFKARSWSPTTTYYARILDRAWGRVLARIPIRAIVPADIVTLYLARDTGRLAPASLNRERAFMRAFWAWILAMELVARPFPSAAWPLKRGAPRRVYRCYTVAEEAALCRVLKDRHRKIVRFAIRTGLRVGEIRAMEWSWVQDEPGGSWLSIPAAVRKQRKALRVPLSTEARRILGGRRAETDRVLILPSGSTLSIVLKRGARNAGLGPEISMHQFRRTFVGRLQRAGISNSLIKYILGSTTDRILDQNYTTPLREEEARRILDGEDA